MVATAIEVTRSELTVAPCDSCKCQYGRPVAREWEGWRTHLPPVTPGAGAVFGFLTQIRIEVYESCRHYVAIRRTISAAMSMKHLIRSEQE